MYFSLEESDQTKPLNIEGYSQLYKFKFSQENVNSFAELTGDNNPLHLDSEYAKSTIFKSPIVHGFFVGSIFSRIFGTKYPGEGTIYLDQSLNFLRPVYMDTYYYAKITVIEVNHIKGKATLLTTVFNENLEDVLTGQASLMNKIYKKN